MKKKIAAVIMTAALTAGMALPAGAETMSVTYRQPNEYTVTIPSSVALAKGGGSTKIEVKDVNIEPNTKIDFKISAGVGEKGAVELSRTDDADTKAVTTVSKTKGGEGIQAGAVFASFTANGSQELFFTEAVAKDGSELKAGTYKGTLTFTVEAPQKN